MATVLKRRLLTSALLIAGTYPISKLQKGHKKPISGVHCWNLLNQANNQALIGGEGGLLLSGYITSQCKNPEQTSMNLNNTQSPSLDPTLNGTPLTSNNPRDGKKKRGCCWPINEGAATHRAPALRAPRALARYQESDYCTTFSGNNAKQTPHAQNLFVFIH